MNNMKLNFRCCVAVNCLLVLQSAVVCFTLLLATILLCYVEWKHFVVRGEA